MKKILAAAMLFVFVIGCDGGDEVVPQAKIAKVTITCEPGQSEIDFDCDGIADAIDRDPTMPNPDQVVLECQTWYDCAGGFACRRGQCEEAKIVITCVPGQSEIDFDCDGIADVVDACPHVAGFNQKSGCP